MARNWCQNFADSGTFDILNFEFAEYFRKEKNTIFEKQQLFEIHWKKVLIGGAVGDTFEDEQ